MAELFTMVNALPETVTHDISSGSNGQGMEHVTADGKDDSVDSVEHGGMVDELVKDSLSQASITKLVTAWQLCTPKMQLLHARKQWKMSGRARSTCHDRPCTDPCQDVDHGDGCAEMRPARRAEGS